jgi:hypothetical protein
VPNPERTTEASPLAAPPPQPSEAAPTAVPATAPAPLPQPDEAATVAAPSTAPLPVPPAPTPAPPSLATWPATSRACSPPAISKAQASRAWVSWAKLGSTQGKMPMDHGISHGVRPLLETPLTVRPPPRPYAYDP